MYQNASVGIGVGLIIMSANRCEKVIKKIDWGTRVDQGNLYRLNLELPYKSILRLGWYLPLHDNSQRS